MKEKDRLETLRLKEQDNDKSPEFAFCLAVKESSNPEIPKVQKKKKKKFPIKALSLSSQRTKKGGSLER